MGKFDGILLATDWDGTFFSGKIYEENIKALKYFEDNGGMFTVCSGRYENFLKSFVNEVPFNTYTICYNGAYITDLATGEVLYEGFCDEHLFDILDNIVKNRLPYATINFYDTSAPDPSVYSFDEYIKQRETLKKRKIYKVLLRAETPEMGQAGAIAANKLELYDYIAVRSWNLSLEILKKENAKGKAIRRVADKLASKLVVAVGDYENDIDMIKEADIGYAVDNAITEVKAVADRITVGVTDSAIAKIIYELEKDIDNK